MESSIITLIIILLFCAAGYSYVRKSRLLLSPRGSSFRLCRDIPVRIPSRRFLSFFLVCFVTTGIYFRKMSYDNVRKHHHHRYYHHLLHGRFSVTGGRGVTTSLSGGYCYLLLRRVYSSNAPVTSLFDLLVFTLDLQVAYNPLCTHTYSTTRIGVL